MKLAVFASLLAGAAAFAPAQKQRTTSVATHMSFENEVGVTPPIGFYDPLGLVKDGDEAKFNRLRFVELKHGRIAMLAVVGYIATATGNRLPGNLDLSGTKFADIDSGFKALAEIPAAGLCQILFFIGLLETSVSIHLMRRMCVCVCFISSLSSDNLSIIRCTVYARLGWWRVGG